MTREERDKVIKILQWLHDNTFLFRSTEEDVKYATENAIKALEKEPSGDAISRQSLLDAFGLSEKTRKWGGDHSGYNTMMLYEIQDVIESEPPVKLQEPTGYWIENAPEYQNIESEKIKYNQGFFDGYKKATEQANAVIEDIKKELQNMKKEYKIRHDYPRADTLGYALLVINKHITGQERSE